MAVGKRGKTKRRVRVHKQPLIFRNPFRSGREDRKAKIMTGPIMSSGMTHADQMAEDRYRKRMELAEELGGVDNVTNDDLGVDMRAYDTGIIALPQGVTSVEAFEKGQNIARQAELFNAKILNEKRRKQQILAKIAKKKKLKELETKVLQYLAETDEIDEVPIEYREELKKYMEANYKQKNYTSREDWENKVRAKREERKKQEEKEKLLARIAANNNYKSHGYYNHWEAPPSLFDLPSSSQHYTSAYDEAIGRSEAIRTDPLPPVALFRPPAPGQQPPERQALIVVPDRQVAAQQGSGRINSSHQVGWRAPRLFNLVQPIDLFTIDQTPQQISDEQKKTLEERREEYKDLQTKKRGNLPPKAMVERAFPKSAEPIYIDDVKIPLPGFVPHRFLIPKHKFSFSVTK